MDPNVLSQETQAVNFQWGVTNNNWEGVRNCPGSMEPMVNPVRTKPCKHLFSKEFAMQYFGPADRFEAKPCPICNTRVDRVKDVSRPVKTFMEQGDEVVKEAQKAVDLCKKQDAAIKALQAELTALKAQQAAAASGAVRIHIPARAAPALQDYPYVEVFTLMGGAPGGPGHTYEVLREFTFLESIEYEKEVQTVMREKKLTRAAAEELIPFRRLAFTYDTKAHPGQEPFFVWMRVEAYKDGHVELKLMSMQREGLESYLDALGFKMDAAEFRVIRNYLNQEVLTGMFTARTAEELDFAMRIIRSQRMPQADLVFMEALVRSPRDWHAVAREHHDYVQAGEQNYLKMKPTREKAKKAREAAKKVQKPEEGKGPPPAARPAAATPASHYSQPPGYYDDKGYLWDDAE